MPACAKLPYPTPVAAARALRGIRATSPTRGEVGLHPCSACHAWHLTSAPSAARNRWTREALGRLAA